MEIENNPYRGGGMPGLEAAPFPSVDAAAAQSLLSRCPRAAATPLTTAPNAARAADVREVLLKDERARMGLGSFKALGAAYVVARDAARGDAAGAVYVAASAGNHGLSVAAGAAAFGARSVTYLAESVPEAFADRLREEGAEVVRAGAVYEDSMAAATARAKAEGWRLLSDSSWPGYFERPYLVMEGYLAMMAEAIGACGAPPSHIFLQAGVGGLAGACAALAREVWGDAPRIIVVEPAEAPALVASIRAGRAVTAPGGVSAMGRLDCKEPSLIALRGLARDADMFATLSEAEGADGAARAAEWDLASTPSGAAGLATLLAAGPHRRALRLDAGSRVLLILSEGPEG